jgi:RNA polymerase sigma factor (sigma-70 family)
MADSEQTKKDEYSIAYLDYYPLVFSAVHLKVGNIDDARDLCQEIFILFFEKFQEIQNKRAWLMGTMKNVMLRYYARKGKDNVNLDDTELRYVNGFRDTRILINEAIDNIECGEKEKLILEMIAKYDFTYKHTAETIGLSIRQVQYKYEVLVGQISAYLKKKGIKDIEDLM